MSNPRAPKRLVSRRVGRTLWRVVRYTGACVLSAFLLVVLGLNLPAGQAILLARVNALMASSLAGKVVIENVGHVGVGTVSDVRVRVHDREGVQVLLVDGARVSFSLFTLATSALFGSGGLRIDLPSVSVAYIDANVDTDGSGNLRMVRAFQPHDTTPRGPSSGGGVALVIERLTLDHAWVHGRPAPSAPEVDADLDRVRVALSSEPARLVLDVEEASIAARNLPNGVNAHLKTAIHFASPSAKNRDRSVRAELNGDVGGVLLSAHGFVDGNELEGLVDVPATAADRVRALVPGAPIYQPVSLHAEARGVWPIVEASARASAGTGSIDVQGHIDASHDTSARATLVAKQIDIGAFSPDGPSSSLAARVEASVTVREDGHVDGTYAIDTQPGTAGHESVPGAHFEGEVRGSTAGHPPLTIAGSGTVHEPGTHIAIQQELRKTKDALSLAFDVDAQVPELGHTRLGKAVRGGVVAHVTGTARLGDAPAVDAAFDARGSDLVQGDTRVGRAWIRVDARGPIANPRIDAMTQMGDLVLAGVRFPIGAMSAHGTTRSTDVSASLEREDGPKIAVRARVEPGAMTTVRDVRISVSRSDEKAELAAKRVSMGGGEMSIEGAVVEGLGDRMLFDGRITRTIVSVRASTNDLDLARVARLLQLGDLRDGRLAMDVDLALRPNGGRGHARLGLTRLAWSKKVEEGSADLDATLDGRRVDATAHAKLGQMGGVDFDTCRAEVPGDGPLGPASWKKILGKMSIDGQIDLAKMATLVPGRSRPFDDLVGKAHIAGTIERTQSDGAPTVHLSVTTQGLAISGKRDRERVDGVRVLDVAPWRIEGTDIDGNLALESKTGAASFSGRIFDGKGTLVSIDARSPSLPYVDWLHGRSSSRETLESVPLAIEVTMPRRELKDLPALLHLGELEGDLQASVRASGTVLRPNVDVTASTSGFRSKLVATTTPLDARVAGHYDGTRAKVDLDVGSGQAETLNATVLLDAPIAGWVTGPSARVPWAASANVRLSGFPLETLTSFSDVAIAGRVEGTATIEGIHADARAHAELSAKNLRFGRVVYPQANVRLDAGNESTEAALHLAQTDGQLDLRARAGTTWGDAMTPHLRESESAVVSIQAKRLRAAAALPFLTSVFSDLDGRVDADARLELNTRGVPTMDGTIALTEGKLQLARMGEPFHDVRGRVVLSREGTMRLEDAVAYGSTGHVNASGIVKMNGFEVVTAQVALQIPKNDPLPVDMDGDQLGEIDGDVRVSLDGATAHATRVRVEVPTLHTALPLSSSNKVQNLGEAANIRIGYFSKPKRFVLLPLDARDLEPETKAPGSAPPNETTVTIVLGDDVEIRKGTTLRVVVEGNPTLRITDKARMSGQIRLKSGILDVQGKRFEIEKGTVSFVGDDPSNPQVFVTAGWTAPDGTRVYADFTGPLKTGKVVLRSEPARPENEILALIMFGTADGSSTTPYATRKADSTTQAGVVAGGFATEGLSKGIDDLTGLQVATKLDTTNSANPSPEIEVQIARDVSIQLAYVIGNLTLPGTNPDRAFLTVDWRFKRNWSLDGTFGNEGTTIMDMIWQYRY